MKIVLGCYYSDNNKGDAAISLATLKGLCKAFPQATFTGLSLDSKMNSEKDFMQEYRYEEQEYGVNILGALYPAPGPAVSKQRALRLLKYFGDFLGSVKYHLFIIIVMLLKRYSGFLLKGEQKRNFQAIVDCDLLVLKGGGYIAGGKKGSLLGLYTDIMRICRFCYSGYIAFALGKPYVLSACSIYGLHTEYGKHMIKWLVNGSAVTMCRENLTHSHLQSIGCDPDKIVVVADEAFALEPASDQDVQAIAEQWNISSFRRNIGVTIVGKYSGVKPNSSLAPIAEQYYRGMAKVLDHLISGYNCQIFIMPQVIECSGSMADSVAVESVMKFVERPEEVTVIDGDYHPQELIAIYKKMNFFIASRFHSGIFAAIAGVPFAAIAYTVAKTEGIMDMLGLSEAVFQIDNFDADRLCDLVSRYLEDDTELWDKYSERVGKLISDANDRHLLYKSAFNRSCDRTSK